MRSRSCSRSRARRSTFSASRPSTGTRRSTRRRTTRSACSRSWAGRTCPSRWGRTVRSSASPTSPRTSTARAGSTGRSCRRAPRSPIAQHAVDFLVEHVTAETVLVPVGPLTNVALALDRGMRPARIVLMGGAVAEGNMTPAAEFNIWVDPEAAQQVFHSGIDVTMIGLDVTHGALLTPAWAERFRRSGRVGTFVAELVEFFKQYHARTYGWDGAPIHDAVAMAHVLRPGIVTHRAPNVEVETDPTSAAAGPSSTTGIAPTASRMRRSAWRSRRMPSSIFCSRASQRSADAARPRTARRCLARRRSARGGSRRGAERRACRAS